MITIFAFINETLSLQIAPRPTSPKHKYRRKLSRYLVRSLMMSSPWKIPFWHNLGGGGGGGGDLFISEVKLKLCLIFRNFKNGPHFEVATNFSTRSNTRSWIYQPNSHDHLWYFEFLIDSTAEILTEINQFQNLTYFVSWWRHWWCHEWHQSFTAKSSGQTSWQT